MNCNFSPIHFNGTGRLNEKGLVPAAALQTPRPEEYAILHNNCPDPDKSMRLNSCTDVNDFGRSDRIQDSFRELSLSFHVREALSGTMILDSSETEFCLCMQDLMIPDAIGWRKQEGDPMVALHEEKNELVSKD